MTRFTTQIDHFARISLAMALIAPLGALGVDLEAGKALAKSKSCVECHGLSGNTGYETEPPVPKLAGQPRAYLVKAMRDYRSGARQDDTMSPIMQPRGDDEIELLADYYAAQKRY
jgi:cytochrome c553